MFEGPASIEGRFFYNDTLDGFNFESKRALLSDVLERLCQELGSESAPALYFRFRVAADLLSPVFSNANHVRSLITAESVRESIWIGNRTRIAAHFDHIDNLACVVGGRRRFTPISFRPDQIRNLYVGPLDLTPAGQPITLVDIRNPDLERFFPAMPRRRKSPKLPNSPPATRSTSPHCGGTTSRRSKTSMYSSIIGGATFQITSTHRRTFSCTAC